MGSLLATYRAVTRELVALRLERAGVEDARARSRASSYAQAAAERMSSASAYSALADYNSVEHECDIAQINAQISACLDHLRLLDAELSHGRIVGID